MAVARENDLGGRRKEEKEERDIHSFKVFVPSFDICLQVFTKLVNRLKLNQLSQL